MELTIDDCMVLAARESATEPELRAAVCVAVGQALHHRYAANGYNEAAEVARRDADRFLADWHSAKRERDEARSRASMLAQDLARAVEEREAFSLRASAAERERDEARAERDALRGDVNRLAARIIAEHPDHAVPDASPEAALRVVADLRAEATVRREIADAIARERRDRDRAAAEIERLTAALERLTAALEVER